MPNKMSRAAAKNSVTTTEDVIQERLSVLEPKKQFIAVAMNMGWQLAGAVLIPVFIGTRLDGHFHTSPSYTLAALIIASLGAVMIIKNIIGDLSKNTAQDIKSITNSKGVKRAK